MSGSHKIGLAAALVAASLAGAAATPVAESRTREPREPDPERKPLRYEIGGPIPDRVSLDPDSEFYFPHWRRIGVRHNGGECRTIAQFCVSEGWADFLIFHGGREKIVDGKPLTRRVAGTVEPYWR